MREILDLFLQAGRHAEYWIGFITGAAVATAGAHAGFALGRRTVKRALRRHP